MRSAQALAAGMAALPDTCHSFAYTQAAWRFFSNERVGLMALAKPLLAAGHQALWESEGEYGLVIHDWSRLNYGRHTRKRDRLKMTHASDIGYELQSSLLVDAESGNPLAPLVQNLVTAEGVHSTRQAGLTKPAPHLDELTERMQWIAAQAWSKPLVHIVDREADSVAHLRAWSKGEHLWLIRAKDTARVRDGTGDRKLAELARALPYTAVRGVEVQGQPATQWVAETTVVLARPARPKRIVGGKRIAPLPGEPLPARLIASRIVDANQAVLSEWWLLTNVPAEVASSTIARWYYYRWQIESMFKLLKSGGHHLEDWLQDDGLALAKRLVVASCACVVVWQLARSQREDARAAQTFLVRLSGRQTKRSRPITYSAMLQGLWQLLIILEVLEHYSLDQLKQFANLAFPRRYRS